jgi:hypothetical protein
MSGARSSSPRRYLRPRRRWRSLVAVAADQQRYSRSPREVLRRTARSLGLALVAAVLAAPFAIAWGIGHARITDYLGPQRVEFSVNYTGEVTVNLGPFGNAYVHSPAAPIGVTMAVGGVNDLTTTDSFFSEQTLTEYTSLYADPREVVRGIVERLGQDAIARSYVAELVLLTGVAVWILRRRLIAPRLLKALSRRRVIALWATITTLTVGSILAPAPPPAQPRLAVTLPAARQLGPLSVDSLLLADLLNRGVTGVTLLASRQEAALNTYVNTANAALLKQYTKIPAPRNDETMFLGLSDLHCNQGMTRLISNLVRLTRPAAVFSSGDDTVNGTAAERGCISHEAAIPDGAPLLVATGNHDSNVTETQMKAAGMIVLDGAVVTVPKIPGDVQVLGDDDPEHNIPFSVQRTLDRPESEQQLGERLVGVALSKRTDVILVHQPLAADVIMRATDPPVRLVLWGHMHAQAGPFVVTHADGSWTVGMQEGTAGGVRQPTFTSFSTPFSPPLVSADVYFYFRDNATGLVTAVQPVHFLPNAHVVIEPRVVTGRISDLPLQTRVKLGAASATPSPEQGR